MRCSSILIVTDDSDMSIAHAEELWHLFVGASSLSEKNVKAVRANDFLGNMILGAELCIFGCAAPRQRDFAHVEKVLAHINLTLRHAAFFSPSPKEAGVEAVRYLSKISADSGIKTVVQPWINGSAGGRPLALKQWVSVIISKS